MVPDEAVREQYLTTLKRESERLTGIVENVLEYARLSRRRSPKGKPAGVQTLSPDALLVRFRPALSRRAEQSNMDLISSINLMGYETRALTVDPQAVERIMMNLIENACKYASMPDDLDEHQAEEFDTRIHLDVTVNAGMLELLVADHGPGIDPSDRARIFGEFQRGAKRKILNRSGLGLGLALSRGLAREMDGDLQLVSRRRSGAEFLLTIPLDDAAQALSASKNQTKPPVSD
ncbi:MAG: HAMP domain-containing histidine kinase, partial [Phycisphaerales bacterium]|nr:HAMP domain-containing histidine kinase [Phycisphaerales bacterium]